MKFIVVSVVVVSFLNMSVSILGGGSELLIGHKNILLLCSCVVMNCKLE